MLLRLLAGAGRFDQLEGGCASNGVVRCRRDVSKAELVVVLGVLGGTDGGRLETREVPTEPRLDDREWLVLREKDCAPDRRAVLHPLPMANYLDCLVDCA